ncbi:MAG: tetratricopeptide repeat protein [Bacteroidetes bacterium]|nr:tetratricopeptide repeat protein [Bacteroidota bacterium]MCY4204110.1 tetratricopeptide repeat protein [Bacteroidota bacterium]
MRNQVYNSHRIELLLQLYEKDASDPFTLFALGFEYQKKGELYEALRWYESIVKITPNYTGVYYHLGKVYVELGRMKDAARIYEKGIEICKKLQEMKDLAELQQASMELDDD